MIESSDELLEDIAGGRCNVSGAVQKISAQWLEELIIMIDINS